MGKYIIAHDLGTTGNKATLFSLDGRLISSSVYSYDTHYYNGSWAEQDPADWWRAVCETTSAMAKLVPPEEIVAMSFSGHMMGCLPVDENGTPLHPHILWCDLRATKQAAELEAKISLRDFYAITGHRLSASYALEKMMWIKENKPDIYKRTACFLNAKDYMVYRLTGQMYTDYSDATGCNAFDINEFVWSKKLLDYAGIDAAKLPKPMPSTTVVGNILPEAAKACGLTQNTKIVLGGGDGACASVGAGSVSVGVTYACLGTSGWLATTTDRPIISDRMIIANWAHAVPGLINPMGTMQSAGASYSWLKNTICHLEIEHGKASGKSPYELINQEIAQAPVGSNGVIFLPYLIGERAPRWNPDAKGCFLGLKMENTRGDVLRSVIEGVGYNLRVILDEFIDNGLKPEKIAAVGGLVIGEIQRRIFADIWNCRVNTLNFTEEAGSIGADVTGGVGIGEYESFEAVHSFWHVTSTVEPDPERAAIYNEYLRVFNKAYDALVGVFADMSALK